MQCFAVVPGRPFDPEETHSALQPQTGALLLTHPAASWGSGPGWGALTAHPAPLLGKKSRTEALIALQWVRCGARARGRVLGSERPFLWVAEPGVEGRSQEF